MTIQFKRNTSAAAKVPTNGSMEVGELALDITGRRIYAGDLSGNPTPMGITDVSGSLQLINPNTIFGNGWMHPSPGDLSNDIPADMNLNGITASGIYRVTTTSNDSLATDQHRNRPIGGPDVGTMTYHYLSVINYPDNNNIQQVYWTSTLGRTISSNPNKNAIYVRQRWNGVWTQWLGTALRPADDISGGIGNSDWQTWAYSSTSAGSLHTLLPNETLRMSLGLSGMLFNYPAAPTSRLVSVRIDQPVGGGNLGLPGIYGAIIIDGMISTGIPLIYTEGSSGEPGSSGANRSAAMIVLPKGSAMRVFPSDGSIINSAYLNVLYKDI